MIDLECDTLAQWVEQCSAVDLGEMWSELREALSRYQGDYQAAARRCHEAQVQQDATATTSALADADQAVAELIAITELLKVVMDAVEWRRGVYRANRWRAWPLGYFVVPDMIPIGPSR